MHKKRDSAWMEMAMFRKPMRIERWIAFDGAFVEAVDDAHSDDASDASEPQCNDSESREPSESQTIQDDPFAPPQEADGEYVQPFFMSIQQLALQNELSFDVTYHTGYYTHQADITLRLPGFVSTSDLDIGDSFLPFWGDGEASFSTGGGLYYAKGTDFFFEIGATEGGSFSIAKQSEVWGDRHAFITENNLHLNLGSRPYVALDVGTDGDFQDIRFFKITKSGGTYSLEQLSASNGGKAYLTYTDDGAMRFILLNKGNTQYGNATITSLLRSLVYTKSADSAADGVTGYSVSLYYRENTTSGKLSDLFTEEEGGVFHEDSAASGSVVINGTTPQPEPEPEPEPGAPDPDPPPVDPDPPVPEPEPEPEPEPDPEPDDPDEPVIDPFVPPIVDGGQGGDSGGQDGAGADAESADAISGGEDGGSGAVAANDGDLVYIYRRDDEYGEERGPLEKEQTGTTDVVAELVGLDEKAMQSYFASMAFELARDMEALLQTVRSDHEKLEQSLSNLREEYLQREPAEWSAAKAFLRTMFETGNREKIAIDRVIGEMNRQIGDFKSLADSKRDGMLTESLRELMDSASRRSGETGALAKALDALADLLRESRQQNAPVPNEADMAKLFDSTLEEAKANWLSRDVRNDPMGKELISLKE